MIKTGIKRTRPLKQPRDVVPQALRKAAHAATDRGAKEALTDTKNRIRTGGMGRFERAVGYSSSLRKSKGVGPLSERAWGSVHLKSKSDRTVGAFESFTRERTSIVPRGTGRWLWIPTGRIPGRVMSGRGASGQPIMRRMTRGGFQRSALRYTVGDLELIVRNNRLAFLIIRDVTVDKNKRNARRATGGRLRVRKRKPFIIAFIGIRRTTRMQRFDPRAIMQRQQRRMGVYIRQSLRQNGLND